MSAIRYWEVLCDAEVETSIPGKTAQCTASVDTMDWYLDKVRKFGRKTGWKRDPNGEDYCPEHAGRLSHE